MNEKLRFLIVGAYNTTFGYVVFMIFYYILHEQIHYLAIALLSHMVAVTSAFVLHRKVVFRSQVGLLPSFLRFNLSTATALLFSLVGMFLLVDFLGVRPLYAQAFVTCVTVVISYVLHRYYTFREPRIT